MEIINEMWKESYDQTGKWMPLSELLKDKTYFPDGAPKSPYGHPYKDANGDHKVDPYFSPMAALVGFRQSLTTP